MVVRLRQVPHEATTASVPTARIEEFLTSNTLETPFVVVDLDVVVDRYRRLAEALPMAEIFYAIKANPAPAILELLVKLGSSFDVASPAEVDMCLAAGADPSRISYGNTVKKRRDITYAYERGVRLFAFDCDAELDKLIELAPGATLFCRVATEGAGAEWPLSRKFGCGPDAAVALLARASEKGHAVGVSFHVGSQQRDPSAWEAALATVGDVFDALRDQGIEPGLVNIGGGFPGQYSTETLSVEAYARVIRKAIATHLGDQPPRIIAEPGRYLVADAGVLQTEVVLVSRRSIDDDLRWVYLDCGVYTGLTEALGEAIKFRIRTPHDGGPTGRVCLAGPTCDSADILYEHTDYQLPLALEAGDRIEILSTGAYTTTYSTVGFNGFPALRDYYLPAQNL
ncbi:MAG TPA: type III PLP-dependent enzyme [Acidimicrobiales bacterium]